MPVRRRPRMPPKITTPVGAREALLDKLDTIAEKQEAATLALIEHERQAGEIDRELAAAYLASAEGEPGADQTITELRAKRDSLAEGIADAEQRLAAARKVGEPVEREVAALVLANPP